MPTLSTAITKSLLATLPAEVAAKFNINEDEVKVFLQNFLNKQFSKNNKQKSTKPKISGYLLYCKEQRKIIKEKNPSITFVDIGRQLGEMWNSLSVEERNEWKKQASDNTEETSSPSSASSSSTTKVIRHEDGKTWIIEGTKFIVSGPKNKEIQGKFRGSKMVALTANDRKTCEENNWTFSE